MPGVSEAQLNFAAAKLTVVGDIPQDELQKQVKKVEDVRLHLANAPESAVKRTFWESYRKLIRTSASLLTLLSGYMIEPHSLLIGNAILLISVLVGGYAVVIKGIRNLLRFNFDMNALMTIAVVGALLIGQWKEGAMVAFLFSISEMLESYSMGKARQSIRSLMDIAPKEATQIQNGKEIKTPVEKLVVGDVIVVKPGEKIAMDGEIIDGRSSISEAAITGESMPVEKVEGDNVYAGSINQQGAIRVRVTKLVEDTAIAKIIHLVEEAQNQRATSQAFVDRFAKYYTPIVMILAAGIVLVPPLLLGGNWHHWIYEGLALLVVACPCALVVSTPVAIVSAIGTAAKNGVLVKGGIFLEMAGQLSAVAFDKTGTLTKGEPEVTDVIVLSDTDEANILSLAAGLEKSSEHPLATAIVKHALEKGHAIPSAKQFTAIAGKGATGEIDGITYYIGNPRLFKELHGTIEEIQCKVETLQEQGKTVMILGTDHSVLGLVAVADQVREHSLGTVQALKNAGVKSTIMLTGDNQETAAAIANIVGVDAFYGELLPEDKVTKVKQLKERYGNVAMVGDGINDAPALATAALGIAMGAGTDTALETADIALLGNDLSKLPYTIKLGKRTVGIIKQNITFALVIKLIAIALVFPGWLTLWFAILADMGATIIVTLNGIRLLGVKAN